MPAKAAALPLKDIKPIVEVPDSSLWLFSAIVIAAVIIIGLLVWWLIRLKKARIDARRAEALRRLDALDLDGDTKKTVYDFSLLGHFVTTPKTEKAFRDLLSALEPYKFKKEVPALDPALKKRIKQFIKEAHRG